MSFCSSCGQKINSDEKFCISCGQRVDAADVVNQANNQIAAGIETKIPANTLPPQSYHMPQVSNSLTEPMSIGSYLLTLFVCYIPLVGLIFTIIWAFDSSANINQRNLCKAILILWIIGIVITIAFVFLAFSAVSGMLQSLPLYNRY